MKAPLRVFTGLTLLLGGCIANNFFLELIISPKMNEFADPGAGSLLTMLQFMGVSFLAFLTSLDWGSGFPRLPPRAAPLQSYASLVAMFVVMSLLNNWAFALHISQPMHMVFRSSGLVASYVIGRRFFSKVYSTGQLRAVVLVTVGTFTATTAEMLVGETAEASARGCCDDVAGIGAKNSMQVNSLQEDAATESAYLLTWALGIGVLLATLVLAAVLGQYQERVRVMYRPSSTEMLLYQHLLALPMFLVTAQGIMARATMWSSSGPVSKELAVLFSQSEEFSWFGPLAHLPIMWFYVVANVLSQFICVKGVFVLASASDALTLTMALTVRKIISLFLSIWFFGNKFTMYHWGGAGFVFAGIVLYNMSR